MKRVIDWLRGTTLRVLLAIFLVSITFLISTAFGYSNSLQAQAQVLTPEATEYKVDSPDSPFQPEAQDTKGNLRESGNNLVEGAKKKTQSTGDNIREKLNLDQPIYPGTKKFAEQVKDKAEEVFNNPES